MAFSSIRPVCWLHAQSLNTNSYIHIYMLSAKVVQAFGNGGHIVLPKEYVGKRVQFVTESKTFEDIQSGALEILKPYLQGISGVYLYGSYARNEQAFRSDIDILVIADTKLKIMGKINDYSIVSTTIDELEYTLEHNAILLLPILKEAKTIVNPGLLEAYKGCRFTRRNTRLFVDDSRRILALNKKGLDLNFEIGSLVYSLMLRIRGLVIIKRILNDQLYSKASLFSYLRGHGFSSQKIGEFYHIYSEERDGRRVVESETITRDDVAKLVSIAEKLLGEVQILLR